MTAVIAPGGSPRSNVRQVIHAVWASARAQLPLAEAAAAEPRVRGRIRLSVPGAAAHDEIDDAARWVAGSILAHSGRAPVELLWSRTT